VHGKQRNIYVHIYSSFFCTLARITHPIEDFIRNVPFYFTNIISESFIWDGNDIPSYLTTAWGWVDVLHELLVLFVTVLPHVHGLLLGEPSGVQPPVKRSCQPHQNLARLSLSNAHAWVVVVAATSYTRTTTPWPQRRRPKRRCGWWRRARGGRTASSGSSAPIKGNALINSTLSLSLSLVLE
jgi:hypothetical protein